MSDPAIDQAMDQAMRRQYEVYPYPARDPADEAKRLVCGSPGPLPEIDHYLWGGARDFARPFRALFAGGGTGDGTIMLAQHLADAGGGEVVYLDPSMAAREIATARAERRGLTNVTFLEGTIEDLPARDLGRFDYIDCCGVLHHLADPAAALKLLADHLAPDGGLGLMVYGELGRTGVYPMQAMLRQIARDLPPADQVATARKLLAALPPSNWIKRNPFLGDLSRSDAELYDLLLHSRDRAYQVPELLALVEGAGLRPVTLVEPSRYRPRTYIQDPALLARLEGLDRWDQAAFAERAAGNLKRHIVYAVRADNTSDTVAALDGAAIPVLWQMSGAEVAKVLAAKRTLSLTMDGLALDLSLPRLAVAVLPLVDGRRPIDEIFRELIGRDRSLKREQFDRQMAQIVDRLNGIGRLYLRRPR